MNRAILPLLLAFSVAAPARAEGHRVGVYTRAGAQLYLSSEQTQGGLGGAIGVRDTIRDRWLLEADAGYLAAIGNVFTLRFAAGAQRSGTWSPSARATFGLGFGGRMSFLTASNPSGASLPALTIGLVFGAFRFKAHDTTISVLELGASKGFDGDGGTLFGLTLLEVGGEL